jgi:hypothetical protein
MGGGRCFSQPLPLRYARGRGVTNSICCWSVIAALWLLLRESIRTGNLKAPRPGADHGAGFLISSVTTLCWLLIFFRSVEHLTHCSVLITPTPLRRSRRLYQEA